MLILETVKGSLIRALISKKERENGFTLIELIIVIAVIGILVAIAIPVYGNIQQNAREKTVASSANSGAKVALVAYNQDKDQPAITEQVKEADTDKITHEVEFTDETIEVTAKMGDEGSSNYAEHTAIARFSGAAPGGGPIVPSDDATFDPPLNVGANSRTSIGLTSHTASALTFVVTAVSCPNGCNLFSVPQHFTTANAPGTFVRCQQANGTIVQRNQLAEGGYGTVYVGGLNNGGSMTRTITLTPCPAGEKVMEVNYATPTNMTAAPVHWVRTP